MQRHTEISAHVVSFCRYLREKGFSVGPNEQTDALTALNSFYLDSSNIFRWVLRGVLTKSRSQQRKFDELYSSYWENWDRAVDSKIKEEQIQVDKESVNPKRKPSLQSIKDWLYGKKNRDETEMASYSPLEVLAYKDFSGFSGDQLQEIRKLINLIARSLTTKYSRRFKPTANGNLDIKATIRKNLRRGGEILDLSFRSRKTRQLKLVMICDVSKSMDLYSRFLIQFIFAFQNNYGKIETFVFSSSLHRVTRYLKEWQFEESLQQLSQNVPDWSGGTKIGDSLKQFLTNYGFKYLDDRTVVLILSDGLDTGNTDNLEFAMKKIQLHAAKVIWLNPLAGSPNYQPETKGMKAAMPYIDVFAPAHNLESLRALARHIH